MRLISKYKNFIRVKVFSKLVLDRILRFKRPKWKKLIRLKKRLIKKKLKKNSVYIYNHLKTNLRIKRWDRLRSFYKSGLNLKRRFDILFDNQFSIKDYKKTLLILKKKFNKNIFLLQFLIKPLFRLDILLWKLNFFNSSYESTNFIRNGFVSINKIKVLNNKYILSFGDIIELNSKFLNKNFYKFLKLNSFFNFIEFDFYTKSFVIIKNYEDCFYNDLMLLIHKRINLKKLVYYINRK